MASILKLLRLASYIFCLWKEIQEKEEHERCCFYIQTQDWYKLVSSRVQRPEVFFMIT